MRRTPSPAGVPERRAADGRRSSTGSGARERGSPRRSDSCRDPPRIRACMSWPTALPVKRIANQLTKAMAAARRLKIPSTIRCGMTSSRRKKTVSRERSRSSRTMIRARSPGGPAPGGAGGPAGGSVPGGSADGCEGGSPGGGATGCSVMRGQHTCPARCRSARPLPRSRPAWPRRPGTGACRRRRLRLRRCRCCQGPARPPTRC